MTTLVFSAGRIVKNLPREFRRSLADDLEEGLKSERSNLIDSAE